MSETNHYSSQLTGQQIDEALMAARNIRNNSGVPVSSGTGLLSFRNLDTTLDGKSGGIPTSPAVMQAIKNTQSTFLNFRGSVPTVDDLPADPQKGDTYKVAADGHFYAWNGSGWDDIGTGAVAPTMASDIPTDDNRNVQEVLNQHQTALDGKAPIVNKNLLDNTWFLVAQAGYGGKHGTVNYAADRWQLISGTVSYNADNGLTLNGTIRQVLENPVAGDVTASVRMTSGTATATYDNSTRYFDITSAGGTIRAAKLEYGSVSTIANDSKPDYAIELLKCQRYYVEAHVGTNLKGVLIGLPASGTRVQGASFPVQMRAAPNIILINPASGHTGCVGDWQTDADITASAIYINNDRFIIGCDNNGTVQYAYIAIADL